MADLGARETVAAFHGDAAIKAELLATLDEGVSTPLSGAGPESPDPAIWADQIGLPLALVLLTAHLGRAVPSLPRGLVAAIEPGAAIVAAAHRLPPWVWEAAPDPLNPMMVSAVGHAAGVEATGLHRRLADGGAVSRAEWRAARANLGRIGQGAGEGGRDDEALAATVMAACCWDYATAPGAAVDMLSAWEGLVSERLRRADGWGEAEDERFQQLIRSQRALALEALGPEPTEDADAAKAHGRRLVERLLERLNTSENPLPARKAALNERILAARAELRQQIAGALLDILREPATAVAS